jgi:predicted glycosyltransferase
MTQPRVLFYVQHLLGIGHIARASRVSAALAADGFDVTMVTGGTAVKGFPDPSVRHVALPPVSSTEGFSGLVDEHGQPVDEAFKARRRDMLIATLHELKPDIVVLEAFPFGRRQVRFELLPLIEAIEAMTPRPKLVTSVRDILQERAKPGRNQETVDLVNAHFDLVMVHGDPAFARIEETFPEATGIRKQVGYTGLVAAPPAPPAAEAFDVLISAGGGAAGADLVRAAIDAALILVPIGRWGLITGPNLPAEARAATEARAPKGMEIFSFRPDFASLLNGAMLSVSQAGYNTVCDILRAGCRSVLVPFAAGGETEQSVRAERLERMGLATVVAEEGLTGEALAAALKTALAGPKPAPAALDLNGAAKSAAMLRSLL